MIRQILVMTRPLAVARRFVGRLSAQALEGVDVVYAPLVTIVPTWVAVDLSGYEGVIFTSANGVAFAPDPKDHRAYCVGENTAAQARAAGWDVRQVTHDADALVAKVSNAQAQGPLLHLCGRHRRGNIDTRLGALGIQVDVHVLYDQQLSPLSAAAHNAVSGERPVILPLFSARTAAHFAAQVTVAPQTIAVVMSGAIAQTLDAIRFANLVVLSEPTGKEMVRRIEKLLQRDRLP